ncbi:MAG: hypothetical protein ABL998_02140 [Planctomycetota bacterium]
MHMLAMLSLAFAPAFAAAQTQVHVVDPNGGGDFTMVGAAYAAAASGDIVLVRPGDYFATGQGLGASGGKSVAFVADGGPPIEMTGLSIEGFEPADWALVQGFQPETGQTSFARVRASAGPVWLDHCVFVHSVLSVGGVFVKDSASVVFTRCELGPPDSVFVDDGVALTSTSSRLHLHASTVLGLDGRVPAVLGNEGSFLEIFGSELRGAPGPDGGFFHCNGFDGGSALVMRTGSRSVTLGSTLAGGAGGAPQTGTSCAPGDDGFDTLLLGGSTLDVRVGDAKRLELTSPVRDDELVQVTITGNPGDRVWIQYSNRPMPGQASSARDGELLVGAPRQTTPLGTIPSSGTLVIQVAAPTLPPGTEGAVFFSQALVRDAVTGRFVLSSPAALVVLDDSF